MGFLKTWIDQYEKGKVGEKLEDRIYFNSQKTSYNSQNYDTLSQFLIFINRKSR